MVEQSNRINTGDAAVPSSILLVEDDETTRLLLAEVVRSAGHQVEVAPDGEHAIQLLTANNFDIVISDIRMHQVDGIDVLTAARHRSNPPEVILLTGYSSVETAVAALRRGAFDYLFKPCTSTELLRCVAAAIERRNAETRRIAAVQILASSLGYAESSPTVPQSTVSSPDLNLPPALTPHAINMQTLPNDHTRYLHVGMVCLDIHRHLATSHGQPLHLTPTEFKLLLTLAERAGQVVNSTTIVQRTHCFGTSEGEAQQLLRPHIRNLRRKLQPGYLVTVRSSGYMLIDPSETPDTP